MVFVAGGATIVSFLVLLTMVKTKIGEFKGKCPFFGVQCTMLIIMRGGFQMKWVCPFSASHYSKQRISKMYNPDAYLEKLRTFNCKSLISLPPPSSPPFRTLISYISAGSLLDRELLSELLDSQSMPF